MRFPSLAGALALFLTSLFLQSGNVRAQSAATDLEKQIDARIAELEQRLKTLKTPQAREMVEKSLESMRNRELMITRIEPGDRWNLVDVQLFPETGGGSSNKTVQNPVDKNLTEVFANTRKVHTRGFSNHTRKTSKRAGRPDTVATGGYDVVISPPPDSLEPGQIFTIGARVSSRSDGQTSAAFGPPGRVHPALKFYQASGKGFREGREGSALLHVDANGKRSRERVTTTLESGRGSKTTKTTYRVKFPERGLPLYARYGVSTHTGSMRVVFVYKYNGSPPPEFSLTALDANPRHHDSKLPAELEPGDLARSPVTRDGTTADGVSQLILKAELTSDARVRFRLEGDGDGSLEPLLGGRTVSVENKHYAFALYTPPEFFGGGALEETPQALFDPAGQPGLRLDEVLEYRNVKVVVEAADGGGEKSLDLKLARPPVVLVHGLTSEPYSCWVKTKDLGTSMTVLLEKAGLLPFLVNYEKTNGTPVMASAGSSFAANSGVVWDRADPWEYQPYYDGWIHTENLPPVISEFQRLEPRRLGGIKQALAHYRENYNLAATQADVIGHSMGGLLARVYASPNYNPDYRRPENFSRGDIHRLITLNTPHHGSELAHVYEALTKAWVKNETWGAWITRMIPSALLGALGGKTPAMRDLASPLTDDEIAPSALGKIGATEIPSYAIATTADHNHFLSREYDEHLMYLHAFGTVGMAFFHNRPLLDDFVRTRADQWKQAPGDLRVNSPAVGDRPVAFDDADAVQSFIETIGRNIDANIYYWQRRRGADHVDELAEQIRRTEVYRFGSLDNDRSHEEEASGTAGGAEEAEETTATRVVRGLSRIGLGGDITRLKGLGKTQDVPAVVISTVRELIFHNDPHNDGAVREASQFGGLPEAHRHTVKGVLHSFSPWHYAVQRKVIELLKWEDSKFAREGFPAAGQLLPRYLPSARASEGRVDGEKAIRWAGLVPTHAQAFAEVADEHDAIIMVRPVNRDATALIAAGNATKAMEVKGKSANWGPQTGFIPVEQRFSKLWRVYAKAPGVRRDQIEEYDAITQKMLTKMHPIAKGRKYALPQALNKTYDGVEYRVLTDPNEPDSEKAIYLFDEAAGVFKDWKTMQEVAVDPEQRKVLEDNPLMVLADGVQDVDPPLYLTADYDLLAIGFFEGVRNDQYPIGEPDAVKSAEFHPLMGYVSTPQIDLIEDLYAYVKATGYEGGRVTHHGPEVQYPKSPYVDYPILVCHPGSPLATGDSEVFIIRQGPPGFRDIHLKRYFAQEIRKGYRLWPNPKSKGWLWEAYHEFDPVRGYDPRDAAALLPYVKEQSDPDLEDIDPDTASPEVSFQYFEEKAEQGDEDAKARLALHYLEGVGTEPDPKRYVELARESAEAGSSIGRAVYAQYLLGNGDKSAADASRAIEMLRKAIREDGHPEALLVLGTAYLDGTGVSKDSEKAFKLFTWASEQGEGYAHFMLGEMHLAGEHVGKDMARARDHYQKAAADDVPEAHSVLGELYWQGVFGERDHGKAAEHLRKAIDLDGSPFDLHALAQITAEGGRGLERNEAEAFELYQRAAKMDHVDSMIALARSYRSGAGVAENPVEACFWYRRAYDPANPDPGLANEGDAYFQTLPSELQDKVRDGYDAFLERHQSSSRSSVRE